MPRKKKDTSSTGGKQAEPNMTPGRSGNVPPVATRFGGPRGNPINKFGRPKSFDKLRELAVEIAISPARDRAGDPLLDVDDHPLTVAEAILKSMAADPKRQKDFIEVAFGRVPLAVEMKQAGKVELVVKYANGSNVNQPAKPPRRTKKGKAQ